MNIETEHIFSDIKLIISLNHNRLDKDIIEITECLNRQYRVELWFDKIQYHVFYFHFSNSDNSDLSESSRTICNQKYLRYCDIISILWYNIDIVSINSINNIKKNNNMIFFDWLYSVVFECYQFFIYLHIHFSLLFNQKLDHI